MKARGYGLKGKSHYNSYVITFRDIILLVLIIFFDILFTILILLGTFKFEFYPEITPLSFDFRQIISVILYIIFMGIPIIINILEEVQWKLSRLKI